MRKQPFELSYDQIDAKRRGNQDFLGMVSRTRSLLSRIFPNRSANT